MNLSRMQKSEKIPDHTKHTKDLSLSDLEIKKSHTSIPPYQGFPTSELRMIFEDPGPGFPGPQNLYSRHCLVCWYGGMGFLVLSIITLIKFIKNKEEAGVRL